MSFWNSKMMRESPPKTTTPWRGRLLRAALGRRPLAGRGGLDAGDQRDAQAAARRHGELLRAQRLAVHHRLGDHGACRVEPVNCARP